MGSWSLVIHSISFLSLVVNFRGSKSCTTVASTEPNQIFFLKDRVWQAGGSADRSLRGKCWIDGHCEKGPFWWLGSHDDSDYAYRSKYVSTFKRLNWCVVFIQGIECWLQYVSMSSEICNYSSWLWKFTIWPYHGYLRSVWQLQLLSTTTFCR